MASKLLYRLASPIVRGRSSYVGPADATLFDRWKRCLRCWTTTLSAGLSAGLAAVTRVVFCGDGAAWIWTDVEALIERPIRGRVYAPSARLYPCQTEPAPDPGVVTEATADPEGGAAVEGAAVEGRHCGVGPGDRADLSQQTGAEESAGEVAELLCWECPPDAIRGLSAARAALTVAAVWKVRFAG